jgi:hypothetical protein
MLPEGKPYTEEQLQEMIRLYNELKQQFVTHRDYASTLLTRVQEGGQLNDQEKKDMMLFIKVSETLNGMEESILGELSANILGICEEAKLKAKDGDQEWMVKWERMQPIYKWYMEVFAERTLPKN